MARSSLRASRDSPSSKLEEEFWNVRLHGELLGGRGISLSEATERLRSGRSLSDPTIFVGLVFVASAIAWPTAVIVLETLPAWICFP